MFRAADTIMIMAGVFASPDARKYGVCDQRADIKDQTEVIDCQIAMDYRQRGFVGAQQPEQRINGHQPDSNENTRR